MNLNDLIHEADLLVQAKGWYKEGSDKPQNARNLTISLVLEAAELLECFQWTENADKSRVSEELADVMIYVAQIANVMNIDLDQAVVQKLNVNKNRKWQV